MQARRAPLGSERHMLTQATESFSTESATVSASLAQRGSYHRCLFALVLSALLVVNVGCEGCMPDFLTRKDKEGEEEKKEKPEKVEPYESKELDVMPTDDSTALQFVKPGHWFSVQQELKSNKADFYGQLDCISSNRSKDPLPLRHSNYRLRTKRVVSLPKGQAKSFELTFFAPTTNGRSQNIYLHSDLRPSYSGTIQWPQSQLASKLRAHQTYMVVLARRPDSYGFLKTLESIKPPTEGMFLSGTVSDYVVVLPDSTKRIPLPSWPLMWTMISYIVWDDFDAAVLSPSQQRALVDWLHWGGQLIVSGPNSLDSMQSSFLKDHLPAKAVSTRPITEDDIALLNEKWSFTENRKNKRIQPLLKLTPETAPEMIEMELADDAQYVPGTGKLLIERRVGRGRIVATAFALPSREFVNWDGFDNLFNGCVMRRPPRQFSDSMETGLIVEWTTGIRGLVRRKRSSVPKWEDVPPAGSNMGNFRPNVPDDTPNRFPIESLLTTKLRYFSRDASASDTSDPGDQKFHLGVGGYSYGQQSGVGGWSDFSACSVAARDGLTEAAGISVPDRHFILVTLGLYLFILVPANWTIFRAIGRVEWAWVAVPIIAMVGTYFVVRLAQLDIGFARSRTEIAVVETQPSYQRAHLTRYTGLYTSLSTSYALSFANDSALSLPFAALGSKERLPTESAQTVDLDRVDKKGTEIRLDRFAVSSNSTEMVHSEEMFDLGGAVRLTETSPDFFRVVNDSPYDFRDVGVVRKVGGTTETAWVGELRSKATVALKFNSTDAEQLTFAGWEAASEDEEQDIGIVKFLRLALNPARLHNGDIRLAGWTDVEMPGLKIEPAASQRFFRTVLVGNLRYGSLPAPESDFSPASDFRSVELISPEDEEAELELVPQ